VLSFRPSSRIRRTGSGSLDLKKLKLAHLNRNQRMLFAFAHVTLSVLVMAATVWIFLDPRIPMDFRFRDGERPGEWSYWLYRYGFGMVALICGFSIATEFYNRIMGKTAPKSRWKPQPETRPRRKRLR
jgi:hypothetical protein